MVGIGNAVYEYSVKFAASKYKYQLFALIGEDEDLVRQIFAASDIYLAPYRIDTFSENELIALRYGAIPVVRSVGSLNDVVVNEENGYKFEKFSKMDMMDALNRALGCFEDKDKWHDMVGRAMRLNFSWGKTSGEYKEIYNIVANTDMKKCVKEILIFFQY